MSQTKLEFDLTKKLVLCNIFLNAGFTLLHEFSEVWIKTVYYNADGRFDRKEFEYSTYNNSFYYTGSWNPNNEQERKKVSFDEMINLLLESDLVDAAEEFMFNSHLF